MSISEIEALFRAAVRMVSGSYMTWNTLMICMTSIRENMPEMEAG